MLFDSQRSAGNSNDLRGKILRVKPQDNGTYAIPPGNLFTDGSANPRSTSWATANPFRISVDRGKDWLYWGEVGPDAAENADARRPAARKATTSSTRQRPRDSSAGRTASRTTSLRQIQLPAKTSGAPFNCAALVNNSPNNTGVKNLPPAQPAWIAYSSNEPLPFDGYDGRAHRHGGATYRWQPGARSTRCRGTSTDRSSSSSTRATGINEVRTDADGKITSVQPFLPTMSWTELIQMRISQSGVMFIAQYGANSTVYRLNYIGTNNQPPTAVASSDVDSGPARSRFVSRARDRPIPKTSRSPTPGTSTATARPIRRPRAPRSSTPTRASSARS